MHSLNEKYLNSLTFSAEQLSILRTIGEYRGKQELYFRQSPEILKGSIWVKKEEATSLANEGRLHAIVVHLKNGEAYLRPEYGTKPFQVIT